MSSINSVDKCTLSLYEEIAQINAAHNVSLVQHIVDKRIFVKKILQVFNKDIYLFLKEHPVANTPSVYEVLEDDDRLIVIEEYISGSSLRARMDSGSVTESQAVDICLQLLKILSSLHHCELSIVHRDIKPENIIIKDSGEVFLLDMNAAKSYHGQAEQDTQLLGTMGYAAPEQYGFGASDLRADLYSVGILLNEMLTGAMPRKTPAQGRLGEIVSRCTKMDPADRYSSDEELIADLSNWNTGPSKSADRSFFAARFKKWLSSHRKLSAAAAAGIAALAALLYTGISRPEPMKAADAPDRAVISSAEEADYIVNISSGIFHVPGCRAVENMNEENRHTYTGTADSLLAAGLRPCKLCIEQDD